MIASSPSMAGKALLKCGAFLAAILCTVCVQEGGFEGPENGPKQRRINNRLLSYRPQHRSGTAHNHAIVRWFSVFRNCAEILVWYKTAISPTRWTVYDI